MTSLDQALIKVFAQDNQVPSDDCEAPNESAKELYVIPDDESNEDVAAKSAAVSDESPSIDDLFTVGSTVDLVSNTFVVDTVVSPLDDLSPNEKPFVKEPTAEESPQLSIEESASERTATPESSLAADDDRPEETEGEEAEEQVAEVDVAEPAKSQPAEPIQPPLAETPKTPFKPAWEVDGFRLPAPCIQMHECLQDQLHSVRSLLREATNSHQKLINIHSWSQGEGRTTLAIALAQFMAQHGNKVLIVDANHDRPSLAETLGMTVDFGWERFVVGNEPLDECCVRSLQDGFSILPMVNGDWSIGDLGFGQSLRTMIDSVLHAFDLVLLDTAAGRPVWSTELDDITAVQLVIRDVRQTSTEALLKMQRHLSQQSNQIVETVDNFSDADIVTLKKTA